MIVKFEPSGTHIKDGILKVRLDVYPEPKDKVYVLHHIQVPIIPSGGYQGKLDAEGSPLDMDDYNRWEDSLPKVWKTNPCLCHFVKIDADTTLDSLAGLAKEIFDKDTLNQLDTLLSVNNPGVLSDVNHLMVAKSGTGERVTSLNDKLKDTINSRLSLLEVRA